MGAPSLSQVARDQRRTRGKPGRKLDASGFTLYREQWLGGGVMTPPPSHCYVFVALGSVGLRGRADAERRHFDVDIRGNPVQVTLENQYLKRVITTERDRPR